MRSRLAAVLSYVLLAGCARGSAHVAGRLDVVAGVYPLAYVAERVGGSHVRVTDLTPAGAEPHDIELSPAQVGEVESADLVLLIHGLQAALDAAAHGDMVLDAAKAATPPPGVAPGDPHLWLDPVELRAVTLAVAGRLAARDPAHATDYAAAGAALAEELTALDSETRAALSSCARHEIVTSHEAFAYLAQRYGLRQVAITGLTPEAEPAPQDLQRVVELVRRTHATTIFFETLVSPRIAETVARETHAKTAVLDPIEGLTPAEASRGEDYFTLMRANLRALRGALGCR
jgi:zinc transport system substrate-binding protein